MEDQITLEEWSESLDHKTFVGCERCYEEFEVNQ